MSSIQTFTNLLTEEEIDYLLGLPEVISAKKQIDSKQTGSVYFSVEITPAIAQVIRELGVALNNTAVPMRWIKGDTHPHFDHCAHAFERTHLVYLTDSTGDLIVDGERHAITKGSAHVFPEGLPHETVGTGCEPRLLVGPMSERGVAVGGVSILANGATDVVYIREYAGVVQYKINNEDWTSVSFPAVVENTAVNKSTDILKLIFTTDFDVISSSMYFICGSDGIQFGDASLKEDGTRPVITIVGVTNHPGLIKNGDDSTNGQDSIYAFNLDVRSDGSTLLPGCGWIGHVYFANGAVGNYIVNCSSNGAIPQDSGGMVGSYAGNGAGQLTIIGCSSSGAIGLNAGGIVGTECGNVTCDSCWSTGAIGENAGGIVGRFALLGSTIQISNCYSTGAIGTNAGGICGAESDTIVTITACYSTGTIINLGGGIIGYKAQGTITNCYSTGTIDGEDAAGGICGFDPVNVTISHCYACGANNYSSGNIIGGSVSIPANCFWENGWSNANASSYLQGVATVGTTWVYTGMNSPYELRQMGYTPYVVNNILTNPQPSLNRVYIVALAAGTTTGPAIVSGKSYTILEKTGGNPGSYASITINSTTGVISTTSSASPATYTLYIRNTGSYNITEVSFNVYSEGPVPCLTEDTLVLTPSGYVNVSELKRGNLIVTSDNRQVEINNVYKTIVPGNLKTFPCRIAKNAIAPNYPPEDLRISQHHLVQYKNKWIMPRKHFPLDKTQSTIKYYHIELPNYITDHLVVNGGTVVESFGATNLPHKKRLHQNEYKKRVTNTHIHKLRSFSISTKKV